MNSIIINWFKIPFKSHLSVSRRRRLFVAYILIIIKLFIAKYIKEITTHTFMGYKVRAGCFIDFYHSFREIFIEDVYYFKSENNSPFILDCGGNIGISVIYFKYLYPKAEIKVFEPHPNNIDILGFNIEANDFKDVEIVAKAVGGEEGTLKMLSDGWGSSIKENILVAKGRDVSGLKKQAHQVSVTTLSKHITKPVDFLKIDVEGAENDVMVELQEKNKFSQINQIALEHHRFSFKENNLSDILAILETNRFDYTFFSYYGNDMSDLLKPGKKRYHMLMAKRIIKQ